MKRSVFVATAVLVAAAVLACGTRSSAPAGARVRLVLEHQPLWGDPEPFARLVAGFTRSHPDVEVVTQSVPNASDVAHQFYLTALEGGSTDFDVMVIDVVWTPEFARAGWAADLSRWISPAEIRAGFLPGAAASVLPEGRTAAVPWYVDVGLLYYRTDLVDAPPRTWADLSRMARAAMRADPSLAGYVWQGRQYEGLNCNVFESLWGEGGDALVGDRILVDTPEGRAALEMLRSLLRTGISPASVTSAAEEETRRVFADGRAVFMRNWPYAWGEMQKPGSRVRGRIGVAPLPGRSGPGPGALGGWNLAVNARISPERQALATELVRHLTSPEASLLLATAYARIPARRDVYDAPELQAQAPFIASLRSAVEHARPRPVSPWYMLITDTLQGEFSAAISGLRSPADALSRAQNLSDHLAGFGR